MSQDKTQKLKESAVEDGVYVILTVTTSFRKHQILNVAGAIRQELV